MTQRKPQITRMLTDADGNRFYGAVDMGWSDSQWARIKSEAIQSAMIKMIPLSWMVVQIEYARETAFTKSLERMCAKLGCKVRYLAVRAQGKGETSVSSWFFIHNPKGSLEKYLDLEESVIRSESIHSEREITSLVTRLFSVAMHPQQFKSSKAKRYSISKDL